MLRALATQNALSDVKPEMPPEGKVAGRDKFGSQRRALPPIFCRMIDLFNRLIGRAADEPPSPADERSALAALLVEAAHSDGHYDTDEADRIARILARRFGMSPEAAIALRTEGEAAHHEAVDLVRFTRAVKDAVAHEERIGVIEAIWEVVYADGEREMHESALVRKLCGLLHVDDRDAGLARQRVAARMGIE